MAWIESHQELARHPKTKKLSRKLNISIATAIGHLHLLWWWALDYAPDGCLSNFEMEDIADAIDYPHEQAEQLIQALLESEFIERDGDDLLLHDWFDYAGRLLEKREQNKERKRKSRSKKESSNVSHAPVTLPSQGKISDDSKSHGATEHNTTEHNTTEHNHTQQNSTEHNNNKSESLSFFTTEFSLTPSAFMVEQLNSLIDDFSDQWVLKALQVALTANRRELRYVTGILNKWKSIGLDEPWKADKPNQSTQTRNKGKPLIPTVQNAPSQGEISKEELEELRQLARKLDEEK